jgi:hypothetical protein
VVTLFNHRLTGGQTVRRRVHGPCSGIAWPGGQTVGVSGQTWVEVVEPGLKWSNQGQSGQTRAGVVQLGSVGSWIDGGGRRGGPKNAQTIMGWARWGWRRGRKRSAGGAAGEEGGREGGEGGGGSVGQLGTLRGMYLRNDQLDRLPESMRGLTRLEVM